MSSIKIMLPNPKVISGFSKYYISPKPLFKHPYRMPDNYYKDNGSFYTYFKSNIKGFDYLPNIGIAHNLYLGGGPQLYIEVSIQKALFGNNYEEWTDEDLYRFVKWLVRVLRVMGIEVAEEAILSARVDKFHFAKNFILPDEKTFKLFFDLLKETKFPRLKGKEIPYSNGGRGYRYHSKIFAISFYDKLSELSIEHPELVKQLRENGVNYVLRGEIQVNDRQKLKKLMKELNFDGEITLATIFNIKRLILVFDRTFKKLDRKAPCCYSDKITITELFKSIKADSISDLKDTFFLLALQKENDIASMKKLISELNMRGSKMLLKKHNVMLTSNPYISNMFLKLLSIVKKYEPIQHSKFDVQKFIDFEI